MEKVAEKFGGPMPLVDGNGEGVPYPSAHLLSTARACLAVMIRHLKPTKVWLPFYTCNTAYQPFVEARIQVGFYAIDKDLRPRTLPELKPGEYFLYTNYFGLCEAQVAELIARYGERLIVDDTHAFFAGPREGIWSFNSARKFFGVPDGAFLFAPEPLPEVADQPRFEGATTRHLELAREGKTEAAKHAEIQYELSLTAKPLRVSATSEKLLSHIDYAQESKIRAANFSALHQRLSATNTLHLSQAEGPAFAFAPAFIYPYLPAGPSRRSSLRRGGVDLQMLWWEVRTRPLEGFAWERDLATRLIPLPIDARYSPADMDRLCNVLGAESSARTHD